MRHLLSDMSEGSRFIIVLLLVIVLLLFLIVPVMASPVTFDFTGSTGAGVVYGSFTYETVQSPYATNVRGLVDNAVYQMTSWNMTAESHVEGLSTITYSPNNGSLEFCQGKCIFGSGSQWHTLLTFNTEHAALRLAFLLGDATPLTSAPEVHEWGAFSLNDTSGYKANNKVLVGMDGPFEVFFQPNALMTSGSLAQSVPEPSSFFLLALALGLTLYFRQRYSYSMRRLSNQDT